MCGHVTEDWLLANGTWAEVSYIPLLGLAHDIFSYTILSPFPQH